MAGAKFEYDENGSTFFYFLLAFEAFLIIPSTIYYLFSKRSAASSVEQSKTCHCENCSIKISRIKDPYQKLKQKVIKCCLAISWLVLIVTFYKVQTVMPVEVVTFDPFQILEVDPEASIAEIKRAYRQLSLIYHPDKATGDEKRFMMLAKAYAALTDAEAKLNWEKYGNPDGPGMTSFGIALPAWIVADENSFLVLGLYAILFFVIAIGIFCYRRMNLNNENVLYSTTKIYYKMLYKSPNMSFKRILMVIAASLEFEHSFNKEIVERESDNVEIPCLIKTLASVGLNEKNREIPLSYGYSIKARALIYSHLSRLELNSVLDEDKAVIIKKCPLLIQEFITCTAQCTLVALAGQIPRSPTLETLDNTIKFSQCLTQALWNNQNCLLQLPHLTEDMLKHFTSRKRSIRNISQLAAMNDDDRRDLLRGLNDHQYHNLMSVMYNMPNVKLEVKAEVMDDEDPTLITAGSLVTVTLSLTRESLGKHLTFKVKERDDKPDVHNLYSLKEEKKQNSADEKDATEVKRKAPVWKQKKKKNANKPKSTNRNSLHANKHTNGVTQTTAIPAKENSSGEDDDKSGVEQPKKEDDEGEVDESGASKDLDDGENWDQFQVPAKKKKLFEKSKKSHLVHCPFFPEEKYEAWWVYIADKKGSNILKTAPLLVTNLVDQEDVELQFSAPLKPGHYSYTCVVRSDSYIDFDVTKVLPLHVKEPSKSNEVLDISDEEEEEEEEESAVEDPDLFTEEDEDSDE